MDVIIQIIIVLIIIASILKRFQDVAQKGQDLDKKKIPDKLFEKLDMEESQKKTWPETVQTPQQEVPVDTSAEPVEVQTMFEKEPTEVQTTIDEGIFETQPEPLIPGEQVYYDEPARVMPPPAATMPKKAVYAEPLKPLMLGFTATQVTTGIVMGEILGPPVALRNVEKI